MKNFELTPARERVTQKDFATRTGISCFRLRNLAKKNLLVPTFEENGRKFYSEAQIADAQKFIAPAVKKSADNQTLAEFLKDKIEREVKSYDGEISHVVTPRVDDDPDDELIDPPEISGKKNTLATPAASQNAEQILHGNNSTAAGEKQTRINVAKKNFLPMSITPNFDAIPQLMKDLPRWLCWRLIPADPKPKKVPMTPKNGRLVNAAVNKPENWLTFDEAQSWYNRGECSGIGFALTKDAPKVCCIDVDHCINPDGSLNEIAQSVIALCGDCWVEKSQSGTGIHIWLIDESFSSERGRKKGSVEVYSFDRYICGTGNHIEGTADNLKIVNGACDAVIAKFIDCTDEGNLFDEKSSREIQIELPNVKANAPMTDADRKLVEYFQSDKCKGHDPNLFALFAGKVDAYSKTTGKRISHSEADDHLLLKILWYVGGSGTDEEITQRALILFNQSGLAKREKWQREDYRERTLTAAFKHWAENGREARKPPINESNSLESLKADLRDAQKDLADFDAEKNTAFEKLRDCQAFAHTTVFSAEIIKAAAFAKNYDAELYSAFARDVKLYGDKHKDVKADMNSWKGSVKNKAIELDARRVDLVTRINQLRAQIETMKFAAQSDMLIPTLPDYQITKEFGIAKVSGEKLIPVAPRPIVISSQVKSVDSGILKFRLAQMTPAGKWQKFPTFDAATISDSRAIIKLANDGLRVTSGNAALLVDYFDKLRTNLEAELPMTYEVARCGWYEFGGQEHFIDPRRPCVFKDDDGKNISVEVSSQSQFATCLTTRGSLDKWREAYELAKKYPVARFAVATAVSPLLLKVLGERNFLTYIFGKTRGGKTTAATLAASTGGSEKIIRSFDATKNGLAGAAADVSDYCFIVDEKQVADNKLKETFDNVIYAIANGIGRLRLNKDGSVRKVQDWRTVGLMTGETRMIEDNTIGGADTRLLSINAGDEVMPPDVCKQIRAIVKNNCGHALPLVVDKVQSLKPELWQEAYEDIQQVFAEDYPDHLDEHRRYIATITLGDAILNGALYGNSEAALLDAIANAKEIFKLIPMTAEFDTTQREIDFVRDFISRNQNQFISKDNKIEFIRGGVFGKLEEVFIYIAVGVLKDACKSAGIDYGKLVDDLIAAGYFVPDDKTEKDRKNRRDTVLQRLGKTPTRCFRINRDKFNE